MAKSPRRPTHMRARERRRRWTLATITREIAAFDGPPKEYWRRRRRHAHGISRGTYYRCLKLLREGKPLYVAGYGAGSRAIPAAARRLLPRRPPPLGARGLAYRCFAAECRLAGLKPCTAGTFRRWLAETFPAWWAE